MKKIISLALVLMLLFNVVAPSANVYAEDNQTNSAEVVAEENREEGEEGTADTQTGKTESENGEIADSKQEQSTNPGSVEQENQPDRQKDDEDIKADPNQDQPNKPNQADLNVQVDEDIKVQGEAEIIVPRGAKDVTDFITKSKPHVYQIDSQEGTTKDIIRDGVLIKYKNGKESTDNDAEPLKLKAGNMIQFDYTWNISEENMPNVKPNDFFIFRLPNNEFLEAFSFNFNTPIIIKSDYDQVKGLGTFTVAEDGTLTATFNQNVDGKLLIKDGKFNVRYSVKEGKEITITEENPHNQSIEVIVIEGKDSSGSGNQKIGTNENKPDKEIQKYGNLIKENGKNYIKWVVRSGLDQYKQLTEELVNKDLKDVDIETRKQVFIYDELKDSRMVVEKEKIYKTESDEFKYVFELRPIMYLMTDEGKLSTYAFVTPVKWIKDYQLPNSGESYEDFKQRMKTELSKFQAAIYPAQGNEGEKIIFNLGDLSVKNAEETYDRYYSNMNIVKTLETILAQGKLTQKQFNNTIKAYNLSKTWEFKQVKDEELKKNIITRQQYEEAIKAYKDKSIPILHYALTFYTTSTVDKNQFVNDARMEWNTDKSSSSKLIKVLYQEASGEAGLEETTSFTVKKEWLGGTGAPEITAVITGDDTEGGKTPSTYKVKLNENNNWQNAFTRVKKYKEVAGKKVEIKYTISEKESLPKYDVKFEYNKDSFDFYITNTKKLDLTINKKWINQIGTEKILFDLYADGVKYNTDPYEIVPVSGKDTWGMTIDNLPRFKDGKEIKYMVKEVKVPSGYTYETKEGKDSITIYNIPTKDLKLKKVWDGSKEKCIRVVIFADGKQQRFIESDGETAALTTYEWTGLAEHYTMPLGTKLGNGKILRNYVVVHTVKDFEAVVKGLPKYNREGNEIKYTAKETHISGDVNGNNPQPIERLKEKYFVAPTEELPNGEGFLFKNKELIKISVEKKWELNDQNTLNTRIATFKLYKGKNGDEEVAEAGTVTIKGNEKATFKPVRKFDDDGKEIKYVVKEVNMPNGFTSKVEGDATVGFVFTNTEKTGVKVKKIWYPAPVAGEKVTIHLQKNGVDFQKVTLDGSEKPAWQHTFADLATEENGQQIKYTVREEKVNGYHAYDVEKIGDEYQFINVKETEVIVEKKWEGPKGHSVKLELHKKVDGGSIKVREITLTAPNWKETISGLPAFGKDGSLIVYEVKEVDVLDAKGLSIKDKYIAKNSTDKGVLIITNTNNEKISIPVQKVWKGTPKTQVKIQLVINKVPSDKPGHILTLEANPQDQFNWKGEFKNLPKYDKDGKEINYTINEVKISGYHSKIDGDMNKGFTVTNTELTGIKVKKVWYPAIPQGKIVTIKVSTVEGKDPKTYTYELDGQIDEFENPAWELTINDLRAYDRTGAKKIYKVEEISIPGFISTKSGDEANGYIFTNAQTKEIEVNKEWIAWDSAVKAVKVQLYRQIAGGLKEKVGSEVELKVTEGWKYTFKNLPITDQAGKEYIYSVDEVNVPVGFEKSIKGFTIINKNTTKRSIKVIKDWVDDNNEAKKRPASIKVILKANGKQKDTVTLPRGTSWEHTFTGLRQYDDQGKLIIYTIEEVKVPKYNTAISGQDEANGVLGNEVKITNTIEGKVSIPVTKKWIGPKASVTVNLLADNVKVDSVVLDQSSGWQHTFKNKPEYNGGKKIVYKVEEVVPAGYTKVSSTGNIKDGFVITNRSDATTKLVVEKKWVGPAKEVTVKLFADGKDTGQTLLLKQNNSWTGEFTGLRVYHELKGHKIVYTVKEVVPTGYEVSYDTKTPGKVKITNTNTETTKITVVKKWNGPAVKEIMLELYQDDEKDSLEVYVMDASDNWTHTFENLPLYATDGHRIKYTVKEVVPTGYQVDYDTGEAGKVVITNTNIEKIEIPVEKKWIGDKGAFATIHLWRKSAKDAEQKVDSIMLRGSEPEPWKHTFKNLDKYSQTTGELYEYFLKEDAIAGYHTSIAGFVVTNRNDGLINIPVKKVWEGSVASEVIVRLWNGVIQVGELKLSAINNWQGSFDNLRQFDENTGLEINYTLTEDKVPSFETEITGDKKNGFTVKNKYVPPYDPYYPPTPPTIPPTTDIPDGEVPEGNTPPTSPTPPTPPTPLIPDVPKKEIPNEPENSPTVPFDDDGIPQGNRELPKTSGTSAGMLYLMGMALVGLGGLLKKKTK